MSGRGSNDLTEGALLWTLLGLASPLLVQNLVQVAQGVIDLFWVGRLSGEAVAAVGLTYPVLGLVFAATNTVPFVGTQVLVSQRVGGEDRRGAQRALVAGLAVALGLAVTIGGLVALTARPLLSVLTATRPATTATVVGLATPYLAVMALGTVLTNTSDTLEAAFVAWGDSRAALWLNLLAVGVNALLDPLLIFGVGPFGGFGIVGAALATVIGYGTSALVGFVLIARGRNGGMLSRAAMPVEVPEIREVLDIGLPSAGQGAASQVVNVIIIAVVVAAGGAPGLAAYILGARVAAIAFVPAQGLQSAAQSVVGQNLGAGLTERAGRATWLGTGVAAGTLALVGVLQWLVPGQLTTLFAPELSGRAAVLSADYLRILAYGYPAIGAVYLLQGGFNGARRTQTSFVSSVLQYWVVRLPLASLGVVVPALGVHAVFWAVTLSNLAAALGLAAYFRREVAGGMLDRAARAASGETPAE